MQYRILSTRNKISQLLTSDGCQTLKLEVSREDSYAEPSMEPKAQSSRSSSPITLTIRPSYLPSRTGNRLQAYRLSLSTLRSNHSHRKQETKRGPENGGHSLSNAWTGIISRRYGGYCNRRGLLHDVLHQVQILRKLLRA
jgi:hypothetical protein